MYPTEVAISPENIQRLTLILKEAYKQIVGEINTATDFGVANRRAILAQIDKILEESGVDVQKFLEEELPQYYKVGADEAVKQLKNTGADVGVTEGFNRVHKDAVIALVDDTARAFGESLSGVGRSANLLLGKAVRDQITQKIAEGQIGGKALREVRQNIKGVLQENGLDALVDKGGRTWKLDRYAEMLFRTKAVETRNRGLANRMVENEYDLVQVSNHGSLHPACAIWEGKVLSVSGLTLGYSTVAEAEASGLFHPNCQHAINALIPSLAKLTKAYIPDEETLDAATLQEELNKASSGVKNIGKEIKSEVKEVLKDMNSEGGFLNLVAPVGVSKDKLTASAVEIAEGWTAGTKSKFDFAMLSNDAATIKQLLPQVPEAYLKVYKPKIDAILSKTGR